MIDGHPFLTDELDQQRARQRRFLALLPENFVHSVAPERGTHYDDAAQSRIQDVPRLECALRQQCDRLFPEMDVFSAELPLLLLDDAHLLVDGRGTGSGVIALNELADIAAEAEGRKRLAEWRKEFTTEWRALMKIVPLLIWAEELAGRIDESTTSKS